MQKPLKYAAFLLFLFTGLIVHGHEHPKPKPSMIRFTENKNQWESFIKYRAQLDGGALFIQDNRLTYHFYDKEASHKMHANPKVKAQEVRRHWFHVNFINSEKSVSIKSLSPSVDYNNYFIGNDPSKWAGHVRNFKEVIYQGLWKGIDLQMLGNDNSLKYNFYIAPGSDVSLIQLEYQGVEKIKIKNNILTITTSINEIVEHEPYAFQIIDGIKKEVPCKFKLTKNILSYEFPKGYNRNYELVIDPVLVFACSSGSTADNFGMTATYDEEGNLYSGGTAFNIGFPTTAGAYDQTFSSNTNYGQTDVVITKYDTSGTFLRYSTYLGGGDDAEVVNSLVVDANNNLYAYGVTGSPDFPATSGAHDNSFNGGKTVRFYNNGAYFEHGTDIYIAKLNNMGSSLLACTFVGGSMNDGLNYTLDSALVGFQPPYGNVYQPRYDSLMFNYGDQNRGEIQLDNAGNVVIASTTRSADFPIINGFDNSLDGSSDAVVCKLSSNLNQLLWSTFIGGSEMESGNALAIDAEDNVFITGGTLSTDFATDPGALQSVYGGGKGDGYIAKIKHNGSQLLHATYLGKNTYDQCFFVQQDVDGAVYVYGQTLGTFNVINATYSVVNGKQFITKMDSTLSTILMQTKFGNGSFAINISPSAFLVDCAKNIYISGWGGNIITSSVTTNMPITSDAFQSTTDGYNFYLMVLSPDAGSLLYGTYFGGPLSREHVDGGTSRFDKKGIIYQSVCAGCWGNDDFPVTPGAWPASVLGSNINQGVNNDGQNGCNNGTFKFNFEYAVPKAQMTTSSTQGCSPVTINFTNTSIAAVQYLWNFGNNDTTSLVMNPVRSFTTPGTYTVTLLAKNTNCFDVWDTAYTIITVYPAPDAQASSAIQPCTNTYNFTNASTIQSGTLSYNWNFGDGNISAISSPSHTYTANGTYTTTLTVTSDHGCKDSVTLPVQLTLLPDTAFGTGSYCLDSIVPVQLNSSGGTSYSWQPATGLSNPSIATPTANPSVSTTYTVTISETDPGGNTCSTIDSLEVIVYPSVVADYTFTPNPCGNTYSFIDNSTAGTTSWNWDFGDNITSQAQNPIHSYSSSSTYSVSLTVSNNFGCNDTIIKTLTLPFFNPIAVNSSQVICYGEQAQLNASGGIAYAWSPSASLSNPNISNPVATPSVSTVYTVSITTLNSFGDTCISSLSTSVNIASLGASQILTSANPDTLYAGESSQINSNINSPYTILWTPNYNLSSNTNPDPLATPLHTVTYTAIATDNNGCKYLLDSVTIVVLARQCDEGSVFVPNTFSPNGDGTNDILYVRSNYVTDLYFAVYNRWGELVFETTDITKGWDGMYKAMKADPGVFGYYLKFTCNNGEESFKKGNVTLIR